MPLDHAVPAIILQAGAFGLDAIPSGGAKPDAAPLASYLAERYPAGHAVTLLDLDMASGSVAASAVTLGELGDSLARAAPATVLFVDAARAGAPAVDHAGAAAVQA